jgi:hypothetical protein
VAPDVMWSTVQRAEACGGDAAAVSVHGTVR